MSKPFHETVVDLIGRVKNVEQLVLIAPHVAETTTPKNHDTIVAAWTNKRAELGLSDDELVLGVRTAILRQKGDAEKKAKAEPAEGGAFGA